MAVLVKADRMQPAGYAAIESAKADGRWDAAYDSPGNASVPDDLQHALDRNKKASAFFATLNKVNRYAVIWRVQTAKKPETRAKRIADLIAKLSRKEKFH